MALYSSAEFLKAYGFADDYLSYFKGADLDFYLRMGGVKYLMVPEAVIQIQRIISDESALQSPIRYWGENQFGKIV